MSEPPTSDSLPKDYRTLGSKDHKELSFKARLMLRKARFVQDIAYDLLLSSGADTKFKLQKYEIDIDPVKLASSIRDYLDFSFEVQKKVKDPEAFLIFCGKK